MKMKLYYQTNLVPLCQCRHCLHRTMLKCRHRPYNNKTMMADKVSKVTRSNVVLGCNFH